MLLPETLVAYAGLSEAISELSVRIVNQCTNEVAANDPEIDLKAAAWITVASTVLLKAVNVLTDDKKLAAIDADVLEDYYKTMISRMKSEQEKKEKAQ